MVRSTRRNDSIRIRTMYIESSSIYIKNWSNLIENGRKQTYFVVLVVIFDINWLLIDFSIFNQTFLSLNRSSNQNGSILYRKRSILYWKGSILYRKRSILYQKDQFYIQIAIVDSDSSLDFESDLNRRLKSAVLESESSKIRFLSPNRISLLPRPANDFKHF